MNRHKKYRRHIGWFDTKDLDRELKEKSITGGISTMLNQFGGFGLNMISTFILARILLPEDFGLIGMVTAFTGFAHIIKDMGLSTAVIQKRTISQRQVSNLFWINISICLVIAIVFILLSPLIVSLYHDDKRIYPILYSYAAGIIISGLALQHNALLCRKMFFTRLAKGNITATLLSVCCGVAAAFAGLGYWSIVILNISVDFFNTCFVWYLCDWRPSLPSKKQPIKEFLKFGAGMSGSNIVNYFSKNTDNVLIGAIIGPAAVGFYSKAFQLLMLPINQLRSPLTLVAMPALSALSNDSRRYLNYYKKYIFILAFFSMPLVAYLAVFSKELILIVLGGKWLESVNIFRILAIGGFILPVANSRGLVLITRGKTKKLLIMVLTMAAVTILGFIIGIHWGVDGVAISLTLTTYLLLIPTLYYTFKNTPIKISDFFKEILLPAIHTLCMIGLLLLFRTLLSDILSPLAVFIILLPVGILFYYFSWRIYTLGRTKLVQIDDLKQIVIQKMLGKTVIGRLKMS